MNDAHFHLVVNHLPIIFPLVALVVLVIGFLSKSEAVKRTACVLFILTAFTVVAAMSSGEGAEEFVEGIKGFSRETIHNHEEAAEKFALLSYLLALVAAASLWLSCKQKAIAKYLFIAMAVIALGVLFLAKNVGTTGGEIKHDEIKKVQTN